MSKSNDPLYIAERLRRTAYRKQKRRNKSKLQGRRCPDCGGTMSWCDSCNVWSRNCCVDYGTCQCS